MQPQRPLRILSVLCGAFCDDISTAKNTEDPQRTQRKSLTLSLPLPQLLQQRPHIFRHFGFEVILVAFHIGEQQPLGV